MARTATTYVVYRVGSNAANQSMTQKMPIGIYDGRGKTARDRETDACARAHAQHTVYANQHLYAVPMARVSGDDQQSAFEHHERRLAELSEPAPSYL